MRPGGSQSITIESEPDSAVGYDAIYADGVAGGNPRHYGGNNGGLTDEKGVYTDSWVVNPSAPAGPVNVNVMAIKLDYEATTLTVKFTVADVTGSCS